MNLTIKLVEPLVAEDVEVYSQTLRDILAAAQLPATVSSTA